MVIFGMRLSWNVAFSAETIDEECKSRKQPISVSNLQELSVTREMDQELQHLLISRTEGELSNPWS